MSDKYGERPDDCPDVGPDVDKVREIVNRFADAGDAVGATCEEMSSAAIRLLGLSFGVTVGITDPLDDRLTNIQMDLARVLIAHCRESGVESRVYFADGG